MKGLNIHQSHVLSESMYSMNSYMISHALECATSFICFSETQLSSLLLYVEVRLRSHWKLKHICSLFPIYSYYSRMLGTGKSCWGGRVRLGSRGCDGWKVCAEYHHWTIGGGCIEAYNWFASWCAPCKFTFFMG